jgi:hypothetical protein
VLSTGSSAHCRADFVSKFSCGLGVTHSDDVLPFYLSFQSHIQILNPSARWIHPSISKLAEVDVRTCSLYQLIPSQILNSSAECWWNTRERICVTFPRERICATFSPGPNSFLVELIPPPSIELITIWNSLKLRTECLADCKGGLRRKRIL